VARTLRAATRGSPLARWQAHHVAALLQATDPDLRVELLVVDTQGDRHLDEPIWELGGKGVFAKEVQAAVLDGRADLAVHSAKDLPSVSPEGLVIAGIPERGDVRDALVGATLADLPEGAEVATGSLRRQAQLAAVRPDLRFVGLRGNMQTRLAKAADHDAVVVAATALDRLGLAHHIAERLAVDLVLPQVGQGALAVECRDDDDDLRARLRAVEHGPTRLAVDAERAFLAELGGDCTLPAGAHAELDADGGLLLHAVLADHVGGRVLRRHERGDDPEALGRTVAASLRAELGADGGAGSGPP
jgi:hydroxymethylbilane synthase